jgi:hypothetical protein
MIRGTQAVKFELRIEDSYDDKYGDNLANVKDDHGVAFALLCCETCD